MAYIVMAYIAMAYIAMAYMAMAYIVMALYSYGLHTYSTAQIDRPARGPGAIMPKMLPSQPICHSERAWRYSDQSAAVAISTPLLIIRRY